MLNFLLQVKFKLEKKTESTPKEKRAFLSKIILNGLKMIDAYIIYWYLNLRKLLGLINVKKIVDNDSLPIVSLTTFPARLNNLWMVLYCIFNQTVLPGKIVIVLANDEVPGGFDSLPRSLRNFADKGVEFIFVDDNLKPHNKYFYSRQKYPNRIMITIDDDLLYYPDTIERLMKLHSRYPDAICTNRTKELSFNGTCLKNYQEWKNLFCERGPSSQLIALGYSAVLYPISFNHFCLYNGNKIKQLSLAADDIWLLVMEVLSNTKVVVGNYYAHPVTIPSSQIFALQKINNGNQAMNDKYLKLLNEEYGFEKILLASLKK